MPAVQYRFLLLNGIVNKADAISRSLTLKREAILDYYGRRARVDVACYGSNEAIDNVHIFRNVGELIRSEVFNLSTCLIYEFGICYDLFDSVHLSPPGARKIGVWHNVTPPELSGSSQGYQLMRISLVQRTNLFCCDHVLCDSQFNLDEIAPLGPEHGGISVLNLPIDDRFLDTGAAGALVADGCFVRPIRFLYVGRFVSSKGTLDLVRAFAETRERYSGVPMELVLVGNVEASDPNYIAEIRRSCAPCANDVRFVGSANQEELVASFAQADVFVMPSYHEGYCVPVLEAMASGCHVIAYDAGNLPSIANGLGRIVPTGNLRALAEAMGDYVSERAEELRTGREANISTATGKLPLSELKRRAQRYARGFSIKDYKKKFLEKLEMVLERN